MGILHINPKGRCSYGRSKYYCSIRFCGIPGWIYCSCRSHRWHSPGDFLNEGESYAVAALSPSVKSASYEVSATSDDIFLFTGNSEIVALQTTDGFSHEGQATLGEWQIVEGSFVDLKIHSETALKVVVDRGIYYHMLSYFGLGILLLLLWAFAMYFTYNS